MADEHDGVPAPAGPPPLPSTTAPAEPAAAPPLPGDVERTPLPERVVPYWQLSSLLVWVPLFLIPLAIAIFVPGLPGFVRVLIVVLPLVLILADVLVIQRKRRAIWWYAVGDEQIDLQHGWPIVMRTVIPMTRVQHVSLQQGPLSRRYDLAEISIHTAAGAVKIPALDAGEGHRIRQHIADLAKIADDL